MSQKGSPVFLSQRRRESSDHSSCFSFRLPEKYFYAPSPRARRTSLSLAHIFHILILFLVLYRRRFDAFSGVDAMHTTACETRRTSYPMTENSQCGRFDRRKNKFIDHELQVLSSGVLLKARSWIYCREITLGERI